ncbi:MAG: GntR family transcriptional regulator [Chloroflexi bacterium]|nr:GntR family transcriptional regulator [Chloroflexota bacterium]
MTANDVNLKDILAPSPKRSLADDVAERIRDAILQGKLEPGARLREEYLAATLDVSRGPVREALTLLEREGLVIAYRNRGAFVARLSLEDLEEVYSLRSVIERLAVQRMMRLNAVEGCAALAAVMADLRTASVQGLTGQQAAELDMQYHDVIYRVAQHRRLYDCWRGMKSQIHVMLLSRHVGAKGFGQSIVNRHQELLDAICSGDERVALEALDSHLQESYQQVSRSYAQVTAGD